MKYAWVFAATLLGSGIAHSQEVPTGFYLGAAIGQATVEMEDEDSSYDFKGDDTSYKLVAGYRILPWVAVEASYIDFGQAQDEVVGVPLRTDYSQSIGQLARKPGRPPVTGRTANAHTLGLTASQYNQQWQVSIVTASLGQGRYCGAAQILTVTFGYDQRTVYVARELPQGSCIHAEVLAHEMRHVAVDEQLLREYVPALKRRLEDVVARLGPAQGDRGPVHLLS